MSSGFFRGKVNYATQSIRKLGNDKGVLRYFRNTAWMVSEKLLRIIAGLFVGVWVARYLGPESFGLLSYVLAFTAIFGGIAKLGLDSILVRVLIDQPQQQQEIYLGTAFWLKLLGAFIAMALIAMVVPFTSNDATTNVYISIVAVGLVFQSFEVVEFYFQSQVLARLVSVCKGIQLAVSSLVKIYLVLTGSELIWFVIIVLVDSLMLSVLLSAAYLFNKKSTFFRYFELKTAKSLLRDSWPLTFTAIVVMIYMRVDQLMIKEMLGEYEVGIYSAALRLSEAWYFIPVVVATSVFPAIINAKNTNENLYYKRLQRLYSLMFWLAVGIAVPMTVLSEWLIVALYGETYREAGQVLTVHTWAGVFVFLGVASSKWLIAENLQMLSFWRTFNGMLVNVFLNFLMIPEYGVKGAAVATLVSQIFAAYAYDFFHHKTRKMFWMKTRAMFFIRLGEKSRC